MSPSSTRIPGPLVAPLLMGRRRALPSSSTKTAPSRTAIVTWVVITEQIADHLGSPSTLTGLLCAIGVMGGSFAWFSLVAHLTQRGKNVLGDKAAWIPRVIGVALMVYAVYLIARAVKYVVT